MSRDEHHIDGIAISARHASAIKNLVQRERSQRLQLKGMDNLFDELHNKNATIDNLRETIDSLQVKVKRSELQMSKLLRSAPLKEPVVASCTKLGQKSENLTTLGDYSRHSRKTMMDETENIRSAEQSDLEPDGAGCSFSSHFDFLEQPSVDSKRDLKRSPRPLHSLVSQTSPQSTDCTQTTQLQGSNRFRPSTPELCPSSSSLPSGTISVSSSRPKSPEVSKDLLEKLLSQNGRLKKVMRDILKYKGLTLNDYLDRQEYEDIVQQLRMELSAKKSSYERLGAVLTQLKGSEINNLAKTCAQLHEKNEQLQMSLVVNKTMVQSYSEAFEKLKKENDALKNQPQSKEAFDQLLKEIKRSRENENKQRIYTESLETENQLQRKQLISFKADYDQTQQELDRLKPKMSAQRDMIMRLTQESQKYKNELRECKAKNQETELGAVSLRKSFAQSIAEDLRQTRRPDLGIDGGPESMVPEDQDSGSTLICNNCERSFTQSESHKYVEHVKKCNDD